MKRISSIALLIVLPLFAFSQGEVPVESVLQKGHSRYVTCVAISPDGKYIATGSMDNTLILWNTLTGKEIRTFTQHTHFIRTVAFSPDGTRLLSSSGDNRALVYDILTGEVLVEIALDKGRLFKACFSPDGSKILTEDDRTEVVVWDAATGEKLKMLEKDYNVDISPGWFTSDGNRVLSRTDHEKAGLIDLSDSLNSRFFPIDQPDGFAISADDKYLAIGGHKQIVKLFETDTGKELHLLDPKKGEGWSGSIVMDLAFSNDSRYLLTSSRHYGIILWDVRKGSQLWKVEPEKDDLDEIVFTPDDKYIVTTGEDETWIYDTRTGKEVMHLSYKGLECLPAMSPDGRYLLATGQNNTAVLWDITRKRQLRSYSGYLNKVRDDGMQFEEGNWYHSLIIRYLGLKSKIALSSDGRYLVKGKTDSVAIMLDMETGKTVRLFEGHSQAVICFDISSDGKYLATGSGDRRIKLWDMETGELIKTLSGHQAVIFDVKFSADGKYLVSAGWDGLLRIWDIDKGRTITYINFESNSPYVADFTPNDLYIVTADLGKKLKLWEVDAGEEFRNIIGHTDVVADVCFTSDDKRMVTAGTDGKVKIWDLLSGMLVAKFTGHRAAVYAVACHPEDLYIASGSQDRSIKIWDPETGRLLQTLKGHSGGVTSLQFSSDGSKLVSCSVDGEIKVWELATFSELYTYIQIDRENWLARNPQGYFDGSPDALKHINYVSGLEVITVGSLFEKYYTPNLIRRITSGKQFAGNPLDLEDLIAAVPAVEMKILPDNSFSDRIHPDTLEWFNDRISLSLEVTDQGGGVEELRLYNNGKLIRNIEYPGNRKQSGKKQEEIFEVPVNAGYNRLTAVALNHDRTESLPVSLTVYYDGVVTDINLYILSVGINEYENPAYRLSYATNDAKSYTRMIKKGATGIFNRIEEFFIRDQDASKEKIREAFNEIAQRAGPGDVFIFYFAGHGAVSMENQGNKGGFYIIPFDVTNLYGDEEQLRQKAISTEEILDMSMQIPSQKQMFILDACQAGGALLAFNSRGASREKAVAQLARSTGTFFLLASGAIQYASEAKDLGHGIFTYAILEALEGNADGGLRDEKITANELKSYVEDRVPELTRQYMLTPQYPTGYGFGQDFPIVMVR